MNFENRVVQYPGKRRLIKVDANNEPTGEEDIYVNIERDEGVDTGGSYNPGTPLSAAILNSAFEEKADINASNINSNNEEGWILKLLNGTVNHGDRIEKLTKGNKGSIKLASGLIINWGPCSTPNPATHGLDVDEYFDTPYTSTNIEVVFAFPNSKRQNANINLLSTRSVIYADRFNWTYLNDAGYAGKRYFAIGY